MGVRELEAYLIRDDIRAGERLLLRNTQYEATIRRIAREQLSEAFFLQHLEDSLLEARLHMIRQIHRYEFVAALFRKTFRMHGGQLNHNRSLCEIVEIPPRILELAAQSPFQEVPLNCGVICFDPSIHREDQTAVTLLHCEHPLRQIVIQLALDKEGVCDKTLREFYTWHREVARNKIRDCIRKYRRTPPSRSLDQQNPETGSTLSDRSALEREAANQTVEQDLEILSDNWQRVIGYLEQIDKLSPDQRYLGIWQERFLRGKPQNQLAREWGITESAMSRRCKKLKQLLVKRFPDLQIPDVRKDDPRQSRRRSRYKE